MVPIGILPDFFPVSCNTEVLRFSTNFFKEALSGNSLMYQQEVMRGSWAVRIQKGQEFR